MKELLDQLERALAVPAAEYVPAIADALAIVGKIRAAAGHEAEALPLAPATEQQKLRDLANRIDHEELWRRDPFDRLEGKMTPEQIDRLDAAVHLRRYSDLLQPGRWRVFPPHGGVSFSAGTMDTVFRMAQRQEARRAARAAEVESGGPHA